MKPVLYSAITEGVVPSDFGVGVLTDCLSSSVKEVRNEIYELELEYAANGLHAEQITPGAFIKAKPNYTDDPQLFQIYKVGKNINGRFTVNAQHISYMLSGKVITSGSANNIVTAVRVVLQGAAGAFTLNTTKNTQGEFRITEPSSVRSWFGGKEGSLLDVYGTGEWYYDNFNATLMLHRGEDRGVTIRYGKNLTELSQEIDMANLVSGIIPYYKDADSNITTGAEVSTGLQGFNRTIAVDFSQDVDPESEIQITTQLATLATSYVSNNNFTTMLTNITLDFVQLQGLSERIDLCDTVHIYFEPLGISASMKCISTTWDVLLERYTEITFGDPKPSITDTVQDTISAAANAQTSAEEANSNAQTAISRVGEKKRVFIDTPVPPYDIGDLWTNGNDIYYCIIPKTVTITDEASGPIAEFNTPLAEPLVNCIVEIPANSTGYESTTITVADGNGAVQATYLVEFGQIITTGGTLNVIEGVLTLHDQEETTIEVPPANVTSLAGDNQISSSVGTIKVEYLIEGFQMSDWNLASDYIGQSRLEDAVSAASDIITGTAGGYIVWHDSNRDGQPDEILIMDTPDIRTATKVWRWNAGGLGYSSNTYTGNYSTAITADGQIVADMITTGSLDALKVTIEHLTATMFEGGKITLGGLDNQSGVLEIKDESGVVIGELTKLGLKFYGAGPVGQRSYVVLNNTDGFKGFDALGNPLFWVNRDEFTMKKCVATNEINACGMLRMLPMTIENSGTVVNRGLAFIPVV